MRKETTTRKRENQTGMSLRIDSKIHKNLSAYCTLKDISMAEWVEKEAKKLPEVVIKEPKENIKKAAHG